MSKLFNKRSNKIGVPPGTLLHIGEQKTQKIKLGLVDYNKERVIEKENATIQECLGCMKGDDSISWVHVGGVHDPELIATIGKQLGLHPLMMEDILNTGQRAKLDDYRDTIYIVTRSLKYNAEKNEVDDEQISIILGKSFVFSFTESSDNQFKDIKERIKKPLSRFRVSGSDYLMYAIIDTIVDNYFVVLEKVDDYLEKLDESLVDHPGRSVLAKIQKMKREMTLLRKWIWPMREVASQLLRIESPLISQSTRVYFRDVHDHAVYAIETIEGFRDIVGNMIDLYLSNISQRLNEIIKVLTIVSTIFVPLTFISSVYGMNFDVMPELHWKYGYPLLLLLMLLVAGGMLAFFKRRHWLD